MCADLVGLRHVEFGEEGERLLPVVPGAVGVAAGVVGVGEAVVGAGLLVPVADLLGDGERGGVLGTGMAGSAIGEKGLAQAVERGGLAATVPDLAEQGEGLLVVVGGLPVAAQPPMDYTEIGQRVALADPVVGLAEQGEGLLVVIGCGLPTVDTVAWLPWFAVRRSGVARATGQPVRLRHRAAADAEAGPGGFVEPVPGDVGVVHELRPLCTVVSRAAGELRNLSNRVVPFPRGDHCGRIP
jgi:hypothetical protein